MTGKTGKIISSLWDNDKIAAREEAKKFVDKARQTTSEAVLQKFKD